jgi:hypothetical protein
MPTRCNRWFLLQILLLAQHVSGIIIPIIKSSVLLSEMLNFELCEMLNVEHWMLNFELWTECWTLNYVKCWTLNWEIFWEFNFGQTVGTDKNNSDRRGLISHGGSPTHWNSDFHAHWRLSTLFYPQFFIWLNRNASKLCKIIVDT